MFDPAGIDPALRAPTAPFNFELAQIEDAGLNAAQPPEQLLVDGWLLRFSSGKARRARSVNAITAGRLSFEEKLALCRHWYARFRLPLLFRITPFSLPEKLDAYLADAGFVAFDETRVMTRALDEAAGDESALHIREVDVHAFAQAAGALRGSPQFQIDAHARRLQTAPLRNLTVRLVGCDQQGTALAAGQVVVERDLAGLYDIVTAPQARGRGHGRAISRRLLAAAQAMGARTAYLQVDAGNAPARRIYAALGFVDRYAYWYRRPAGATDQILV